MSTDLSPTTPQTPRLSNAMQLFSQFSSAAAAAAAGHHPISPTLNSNNNNNSMPPLNLSSTASHHHHHSHQQHHHGLQLSPNSLILQKKQSRPTFTGHQVCQLF